MIALWFAAAFVLGSGFLGLSYYMMIRSASQAPPQPPLEKPPGETANPNRSQQP